MNDQIHQQLNQITLLLNEVQVTGIENMSRILTVINIVSKLRQDIGEIMKTDEDLNRQIESLKEDLKRAGERHTNVPDVIPMVPPEETDDPSEA